METEAKANVVASVWGPELDEFNLFFQIDQGKTASAARNLINSVPREAAFAFYSVFILLLWRVRSMWDENSRNMVTLTLQRNFGFSNRTVYTCKETNLRAHNCRKNKVNSTDV